MAAVGLPIWTVGVWADTVWAAGVWQETATVVVATPLLLLLGIGD